MVKPIHKPLKAYRKLSILCVFLLFAAFILLLLVGLSLPIVHPVYVLRVFATDAQDGSSLSTELRFGVWGVCAYSTLNPASVINDDGLCYGPRLGYQDVIPASILAEVNLSQSLVDAALQGLMAVLLIHIVAAGLSLFTLFTSIFLASHCMTILSLILAITTALLSAVVFVVDAVIVGVARAKVPELTSDGLGANVGNAVWMVLGALIASWLGVILLSARACYCCGVRRKEYDSDEEKF
ncbi:hypothetical protein GYMLUDRAFT_59180 [Collybiopsis luxurians FD-317 M1]|uniref:Unplaced genomic scaffold GYMLUscaffold_24, whole genome shotgun sequence n=1 Tax=Collybiopsis luxurians FD-317 M1 TaxID=944289 RepID=A0A0D0BC18_9AGAR|nr:hypothetical protein GYMLUDRAFT_59180 [Collybiopsis luxurians FD-317 M1]